LLGDEKSVFLTEILTPVLNSHMANVEELKGVRKARDSARTAMVGVLRFSMSESLTVEFQGLTSRAMAKPTLVKMTGDLKSVGSLKGKVSIISYVIFSIKVDLSGSRRQLSCGTGKEFEKIRKGK
jgi:hypothetical protein